MTDSLRDQLLGLGFKAPAPVEKAPARPRDGQAPGRVDRGQPRHGQPAHGKAAPGKPAQGAPHRGRPPGKSADASARPQGGRPAASPRPPGRAPRDAEMDLAKAYAIRAQREKDERIEAERLRQEEAARKRAAKAQVIELLKDQVLNDPAAEIARHFDYGGKIKRIHVNPDQLRALNAGELAVVQLDGRYQLVAASVADAVAGLLPSLVALRVDPAAPATEDPYADPMFQVPDDLVW